MPVEKIPTIEEAIAIVAARLHFRSSAAIFASDRPVEWQSIIWETLAAQLAAVRGALLDSLRMKNSHEDDPCPCYSCVRTIRALALLRVKP